MKIHLLALDGSLYVLSEAYRVWISAGLDKLIFLVYFQKETLLNSLSDMKSAVIQTVFDTDLYTKKIITKDDCIKTKQSL